MAKSNTNVNVNANAKHQMSNAECQMPRFKCYLAVGGAIALRKHSYLALAVALVLVLEQTTTTPREHGHHCCNKQATLCRDVEISRLMATQSAASKCVWSTYRSSVASSTSSASAT